MTSLPVLLLPGLDGHTHMVAGAAPAWFPGERWAIFDHRGDRAEGGLVGLAERALAAAAEVVGAGPLLVCGESFGGAVALALAHAHPERVAGLVLLSTFASYPALRCLLSEVGLRLWDRLGDRAADRLFRAARPLGIPGALGLRFSRAALRAYLVQSPVDMAAYRAKCALSVRLDARPWLPAIAAPALVVAGTYDLVVPPAASRQLAAALPRARLEPLRGGHLVHFVQAARVGALIAAWRAQHGLAAGEHALAGSGA
jgi:pimeloyl-ACP methyl ester carboxylesterase